MNVADAAITPAPQVPSLDGGWSEEEQLAFLRSPELAELVQELLHPGLPDAGVNRPQYAVSVLEEHHRPGAGVSVILEAVPLGGDPVFLGASTQRLPSVPEHVATLQAGENTVVVWLHPYDPLLPGLASASVPEQVEAWWAPEGIESLETLAYRPLRRAVLRARTTQGETLFLKVLHRDADLLRERHLLLDAAGIPVPSLVDPVASHQEGLRAPSDVVVTRQAAGISVAQALMDGNAAPLSAQSIVDLLDRFPEAVLQLPRRAPWSAHSAAHAHAVELAFPALTVPARELAARLRGLTDREPAGREVPTHGDLYEANVLVANGAVSALLDLDAVGPGHRVDDLACYLGHLAVLPQLDDQYAQVGAYLESLAAPFEEDASAHGSTAAALWARTAAVVLSLVAGAADEDHEDPVAVAAQRLSLADSLLQRASTDS